MNHPAINEDGWIEHDGSPRPVPADAIVQVKYRRRFQSDPEGISAPARADWFYLRGSADWWQHQSPVRTNDIIAYLVVQS